MSAAARIIDRLDRVRQTAPGRWIARCPAHEDRSPSLSIREIDDRVLIHDHGGCATAEVLGALGLGLADLYDRPLSHHARPSHSRVPAGDLLTILDHETTVAALIVHDVLDRRAVDAAQWQRLAQAASRIGAARDAARPAEVRRHA